MSNTLTTREKGVLLVKILRNHGHSEHFMLEQVEYLEEEGYLKLLEVTYDSGGTFEVTDAGLALIEEQLQLPVQENLFDGLSQL